jgi:diguanylate cyclase (GGDEF)-like protein/PAS domain S-box-containing protein
MLGVEGLRMVMANLPVVLFAFDAEGICTFLEGKALEPFGIDPARIRGKTLFGLYREHHDSRGNLRRVLGGESFSSIVHIAGRAFEVHYRPLREGDGPITGGIGVAIDSTGRDEAEEALRVSEERWRALVQHVTDIITVLDAEGRVRYSSPAAMRVLGYPEGFWRGHSVFELVHPDDAPRVVATFAARRNEPGLVEPLEFRMRHADGTWRYVEAVGNNLLDDPTIDAMIVTTRDVTERREAEEALRASEARFRSLVQKSYDVTAVCEADGKVRYVTPSVETVLGLPPEEVVGRNGYEFAHPDDEKALEASMARLLGGESGQRPVQFRARHRDGSYRWVELVPTNLFDDPDVNGVVLNIRDVTDRRRAEDELRLLQTIVLAVNEAPDLGSALEVTVRRVCEVTGWVCGAVWTPAPDGTVLELQGTWSLDEPELTAFCRERQDMGMAPGVGLAGRAWASGEPLLTRHLESEGPSGAGLEVSVAVPVLAEREVVAVLELFHRAASDDDERVVSLVAAVASQLGTVIERKRAQERLAHQALHDPLTELPNRALFLDRLALALARLRRRPTNLAVLFADVDRFKVVNDSLGHDAGDRLLVALARRLRDVLRPGDTLARFGGDEFAVLCEDVEPRDIDGIAHRMMEALAEPFSVGGDEVFATMSVGIAVANDADERPAALLRDADAAMYLAKDRGRARFELFDEAMRDQSIERLVMENALRRAPERGQLRVVYQPIVRLDDGAFIGAEALVRWAHPDRGLLEPAQFIPLAEDTGVIVSIGRWVLAEACREAVRWNGGGKRPSVSVNVSARELPRPDLVEGVAAALGESGLDPDRLWLEITESVLMDDADLAVEALGRLRELGLHLAVDDFGTGYSSLSYLRRFPVDSLKVDRSFVAGLQEDAGDAAIVEAVVSMAHSLHLSVIAEGVETDAQLSRLRGLGCEAAQGYYFAAPVPASALSSFTGRAGRW